MPCEKCEKKWGKLITPDTWKTGSKSHHSKVKLNENKFLTKGKNRFDPTKKEKMKECRICKMILHQKGAHFCSTCAFQKGICMMCGKKVQKTAGAKMSIT